jgi:hypothetical protein
VVLVDDTMFIKSRIDNVTRHENGSVPRPTTCARLADLHVRSDDADRRGSTFLIMAAIGVTATTTTITGAKNERPMIMILIFVTWGCASASGNDAN